MTNFIEWYMRVEDDDLGSVHDCVWDGDYCKARDVQSILEEAFETGYDKAGARVKELKSALVCIMLGPSYNETHEEAMLEMMRIACEALKETNK
jgi:fructoselysine-6-P-deglycase FrlB-like protein